jgi:hypothetical protein
MTSADLFINIEGINQYAPKFDQEIYTFYLNENSPFNTTIGYLNATDPDQFLDYGLVKYELKNGQERFEIDQRTGRLYTISRIPEQQLDRELIDTFFMNAEAIDGPGLRTSTQIIVKLLDTNDNAPQFIMNNNNQQNFNLNILNTKNQSSKFLLGYIEENSQDKWIECVRLHATDRDSDLNGQIVYEVLDSDFNFKSYFEIENGTNRIKLVNNKSLDFEEIRALKYSNSSKHVTNIRIKLNPGEIDLNLIVIAKDMGQPSLNSTMLVKIIVKDVNDNKPFFEKLFYSAEVAESARYGDVIQLRALDFDAPNTANSKIIYSIESGAKNKFTIDPNSGLIKIVENAELDRETFGAQYLLKIVATNYNSFTNINSTASSTQKDMRKNLEFDQIFNMLHLSRRNLTSTYYCYLKIDIVDVNNKRPYFLRNNE